MKKSKKLIIVIMVVMLLGVGLSLTAFAAAPSTTYPSNTNNYQYVFHYRQSHDPNKEIIVYSETKAVYVNETTVKYTTGLLHQYQWTGDVWVNSGIQNTAYGEWTLTGIAYIFSGTNFDIGTYVAPYGNITSPLEQGYEEYQDITFTYGGYEASDIWVEVKYISPDGNDVNYIIGGNITHFNTEDGTGIIHASDIPYGIGVNKIRLYGDYQLLDEVWVTIQRAAMISEAKLIGVENGTSYEKPPNLSVIKIFYADPVGLSVNGRIYQIFNDFEKTYPLYRNWTANVKIGSNTVQLVNMNSDEILESYTFTVLRGSTDENGNYIPPDGGNNGGNGLPSGWDQVMENAPVKPETGDVLGWISYIGQMIGWVFNVAITAVSEFGKSIAASLESLFSIFTPVLSFLSAVFSAIPTPLAIGLYAVFTLACVVAIIKFIKG